MPEAIACMKHDKELLVMNAAASAFLAHGFSGTSTDMIQRKAGVSKATMYSCFPNKEALFAAVIEHQCAKMAATIQAIEASSGNIAKTLTDVGRSYLEVVLSPEGLALYRVAVAEAPRFPELGRRFYLAGPKTVTLLVTAHLSKAAQSGEIDLQVIGVEAAAGLFISMIRAEGQMELLTHPDAHPSAVQIDQWVQLAVTTFLSAFGPRE